MTAKQASFSAPQGRRPTLDWLTPVELSVDTAYQRSIDTPASRRLIGGIAASWRWDLCLPLLVSRRPDGSHYVVDGQHRLAAALLRKDIPVLPCFIRDLDGAASEAALFIHANRARKTMSALDDYHAAVAAGDETLCKIDEMVRHAGLSIARHNSAKAWSPGEMTCVAGIRRHLRQRGEEAVRSSLKTMGQAFGDEVIANPGAIFGGLVMIYANPPAQLALSSFPTMLGTRSSQEWCERAGVDACRSGPSRDAAMRDIFLAGAGIKRAPAPAAPIPSVNGPSRQASAARPSFEQQLERVRQGAPIAKVEPIRKADPNTGGSSADFVA